MSIDRLIVELDKEEERDFTIIKSLGEKNLEDYIGVVRAYIDLLNSVKDNPQKTICVTKIIQEIMSNIAGLSSLIKNATEIKPCKNTIDRVTGQILRGECSINELLEQFEELSHKS